ncbi:MAG: phosphate ABC transporter permease PstA [Bacteroidales bacterium]|nr:phosphate ABC transporter permease PstA [Bacteroidales bacterium]
MKRLKKRKAEETVFKMVMIISSFIIIAALSTIILSIILKGVPSLSWQMVSETPKGGYYFGKEGGILNAIIGSIYLAFGATILAFLIALPVALYMNVHLINKQKLVQSIRFFMDVLWGIPSIVYGAFAFTMMIYLGAKTSLLAGIITVALFITPIMIRSIDEVLKTVPRGLLEASLSLGSTKSEVSIIVYVRQCLPGIITGVLLSFGRAIGDAASVLFTTGFTDNIPTSLSQPTATLPLSIFFQLTSPIPEVKGRAYASAVVLTIIILIISISSRLFSRKFAKTITK